MTKLQAAGKDQSAQKWGSAKSSYKVGSAFKGCHNCGHFHMVEIGGRKKKIYEDGFDVSRAYYPRHMGWTYKCFTCGATDQAAWEDAIDIGLEPICGNREVVRMKKAALRKEFKERALAAIQAHAAKAPAVGIVSAKTQQIQELQERIARLELMIKAQVKK